MMNFKNKDSRIIAITGKGGTGKSALASIMAKILARRNGARLLVIDADSATSLSQTLGMKVDRTISDIRKEMLSDPKARKKLAESNTCSLISGIITQKGNIHLLVMGRPEDSGCYCAVNDLLKYGIESITKNYTVTIVDGEAGPEQINRRVLENVDTLIIVADTSSRSLQTAASIRSIAMESRPDDYSGPLLVINRMKEGSTAIVQRARDMEFSIIGVIPDDECIAKFDLMNIPLDLLPEDSPSIAAVTKMLNKMGFCIQERTNHE